jgi:hypothetical protein
VLVLVPEGRPHDVDYEHEQEHEYGQLHRRGSNRLARLYACRGTMIG